MQKEKVEPVLATMKEEVKAVEKSPQDLSNEALEGLMAKKIQAKVAERPRTDSVIVEERSNALIDDMLEKMNAADVEEKAEIPVEKKSGLNEVESLMAQMEGFSKQDLSISTALDSLSLDIEPAPKSSRRRRRPRHSGGKEKKRRRGSGSNCSGSEADKSDDGSARGRSSIKETKKKKKTRSTTPSSKPVIPRVVGVPRAATTVGPPSKSTSKKDKGRRTHREKSKREKDKDLIKLSDKEKRKAKRTITQLDIAPALTISSKVILLLLRVFSYDEEW